MIPNATPPGQPTGPTILQFPPEKVQPLPLVRQTRDDETNRRRARINGLLLTDAIVRGDTHELDDILRETRR
ncbi:MAG: hypothetical protein ACE361_19395 [Aureliella sp.]